LLVFSLAKSVCSFPCSPSKICVTVVPTKRQ
jgi:hypothetical protein